MHFGTWYKTKKAVLLFLFTKELPRQRFRAQTEKDKWLSILGSSLQNWIHLEVRAREFIFRLWKWLSLALFAWLRVICTANLEIYIYWNIVPFFLQTTALHKTQDLNPCLAACRVWRTVSCFHHRVHSSQSVHVQRKGLIFQKLVILA